MNFQNLDLNCCPTIRLEEASERATNGSAKRRLATLAARRRTDSSAAVMQYMNDSKMFSKKTSRSVGSSGAPSKSVRGEASKKCRMLHIIVTGDADSAPLRGPTWSPIYMSVNTTEMDYNDG